MSGMRPLGKLISLEEALRVIDKASRPTQRTEEVHIWSASGRIIAEDVKAGIDVPSFTRSAMDGFAVRYDDIKSASNENPAALNVVEKVFAGGISRKKLSKGQCVEIATGGMMPHGADTVVMVEDTARKSLNRISILRAIAKGRNVIVPGEDIRRGTTIVRKGSLLTPAKIGSIAAVGRENIECYCRPSVVVMPTGDEVVRPGEQLKPGQVYDVNTFTLKSAIQSFGGAVDIREIVNDSKKSLVEAISSEDAADIVIFSGGSSVGEKDLIVDAVSELGKVLFHGVAVRPGKPTLLGIVGNTLVLGMPGNPTSCLSNAYIFLEPMMAKIGRYPRKEKPKLMLKMSSDARLSPGRATVIPVKVDGGKAVPVFKESSAITSMTNADGYVLVWPETKSLKKGSGVEVVLF